MTTPTTAARSNAGRQTVPKGDLLNQPLGTNRLPNRHTKEEEAA